MELAGLTAAMGQTSQPQRACPRCNSSNTKFCYFNNYSLSQPRYFCKACRRYWTHGGTLRNVPVGGSSRKSKRPRDPAPNSPAPPGDPLSAASAPGLFQLHGGGGFLSSMRLQPPVLQDLAVPFEWQQSVIGGGGDHGNSKAAPPPLPAVTGAQFWTLGGASSGGGGDRGRASNPDQCLGFPGVDGI